MDRYEYKLKLEQIKNLAEAKEYEAAARIADEINWRKVKSIATLCMIADIYENTKQFEDSKDLLLVAYDRSPTGRTIVYRLAWLALKMGDIEEAQEYYEDFIEIAPHDNTKYVLRYEIAKAKGVSVQELIEILEEFKEREYTEKWAFELAYLHHKGGNIEKCVDICDELILWFGEGKYVEKALELKMLYQPLNKLQQDKYRRFKQKKEGVVEVSPYEQLKSGEIVREKVTIPRVTQDSVRFNTMNLQEEIAKSMQQIMQKESEMVISPERKTGKIGGQTQEFVLNWKNKKQAKEESEEIGAFTPTQKNVKQEIPELTPTSEREKQVKEEPEEVRTFTPKRKIDKQVEEEAKEAGTFTSVPESHEQEIPGFTSTLDSVKQEMSDFTSIPESHEQEIPGFTSMQENVKQEIPEFASTPESDKQVEEEPEEVPAFIPKRKRDKQAKKEARRFLPKWKLGRKAKADAEKEIQKQEEPVNAENLSQNNGQMSIEEILAGWDKIQENARNVREEAEQRKLERDREQERQEAEYIMNRLAGVIPTGDQIQDMVREELLTDKMSQQEQGTDSLEMMDDMEVVSTEEGSTEETEEAVVSEEMTKPEEVVLAEEGSTEKVEEVALSEELAITKEELTEVIGAMKERTAENVEDAKEISDVKETFLEDIKEISDVKETFLEDVKEKEEEIIHQQERIQQELEQQIREEHILKREVTFFDAELEEEPMGELSTEQKEIFTYFTLIDGMEQQICQALEGMKQRKKHNQTSVAGNLAISGRKGSGKTVLATNFVKAYQKLAEKENCKVGKISGSNMNKKNISELFAAIEGGCLIIEKAGDLSRETVIKLSTFMEKNTQGLLVILEDDSSGIQKVLARDANFTKKFTERIQIPIFTSDELVAFAKAYAREYHCEIEEMGVLALYNSISSIQRLDEATTLIEIKEIMDDAIHRANRGGLMKIFGGKRTTDRGLVLIREKDFN